MKIIVTYASAGAGHLKAAEAVYNYIKLQDKDVRVELVDVLSKANYLFRNTYTKGYSFVITHLPWIWAFLFWITHFKPFRSIIKYPTLIADYINVKPFADFLIREDPDIIVSAHFLSSEIAAFLKRSKKINSKIITIVTDFMVHPFWLSEGTDMYIAASEFTKNELIREGISEDKINVLGIPIHTKFLVRYPRNILCKKFGIVDGKFTVLIITGSFGIGPIEDIVAELYQEVQILVVCANNQKLYDRLKSKNYPNVKIFGFVDNINELMGVADVIITKPGGMSISEALSMDLIPIFISAIPGQEKGNITALRHYGIAIEARHIEKIKYIVLDFKNHPERLKQIKENISLVKRPYAVQELYDVIRKSGFGAGS